MQKVPLTQEGLDQKKQEMSELPEDEFRRQLQLLQTETRSWLMDNLILDADQVEYINEMSDEFLAYLGKQLAMGFDYDLEMILDFPVSTEKAALSLCKNRKVETHVTGGGSWTPGQPPVIGPVRVTVGIPIFRH